MDTTFIYTLSDPRTNQVRYVGKTNNPYQRYRAHNNKARKESTHRKNWIESLRKQGLKPKIEILEEVSRTEWKFWECFWIQQFKIWGFDLVNATGGGDGLTMGNQTSFKKGHVPWHAGTARSKEIKEPKTPTYLQENSIVKRFKKGSTPWNKGKTGQKSTGLKSSRHVLQYDLQNNFIKEFLGCLEASIEMNCIPESIRSCCVGKTKSSKGFIWKYK